MKLGAFWFLIPDKFCHPSSRDGVASSCFLCSFPPLRGKTKSPLPSPPISTNFAMLVLPFSGFSMLELLFPLRCPSPLHDLFLPPNSRMILFFVHVGCRSMFVCAVSSESQVHSALRSAPPCPFMKVSTCRRHLVPLTALTPLACADLQPPV